MMTIIFLLEVMTKMFFIRNDDDNEMTTMMLPIINYGRICFSEAAKDANKIDR